MTAQVRNNFIEGFNYYVPSMQAGGELGQLMDARVSFGNPPDVSAAGILSAGSNATAAPVITTFAATYTRVKMAPYGRNLTIVASAAAANVVNVYGRDYLGQPMKEAFTLNGTTPVVGVKAFAYIDKVEPVTGTGATTVNLGWGTKFGLPYKTRAVVREYTDQVVAAAGTLTAPVLTDPQTTVTGDPRGLYVPTTTPDGVKVLEIDAKFDKSLNAAGRGGLHGIVHFNV